MSNTDSLTFRLQHGYFEVLADFDGFTAGVALYYSPPFPNLKLEEWCQQYLRPHGQIHDHVVSFYSNNEPALDIGAAS